MSLGRPPSIRTRLALIYTGLLAVALIVFGTGVFLALRSELERSFDSALLANAEHAGGAFAQDVDAAGALHPSERLVEQFASTGGRVVVLAPNRSVLADSAGSGVEPLPLADQDLAAADRHQHAVREVEVANDVVRMMVEPVIAAGGELLGYVAWAGSTAPLRDVLRTVTTALILGGTIIVALALGGGLALARRALAPIVDVTDTARAIALSGE